MKTTVYRWFILATLVVAMNFGFGTAVAAPPVHHVVGVDFPDALPMMGSEMQYREWIVTNRECLCSVILQFTDKNGVLQEPSNTATPTTFPKYADFVHYVLTNVTHGIQFIKSRYNIDASTDINFALAIGDLDLDTYPYDDLIVNYTNIGKLSSVSYNAVTNICPTWELAQVAADDLQRLQIHVASTPPYDYDSAVPDSGSVDYPEQAFSSTTLFLNQWYCVGTNRVRISPTVGANTSTFTQAGAQLLPATVEINRSRKGSSGTTNDVLTRASVIVSMTPGSDTTVQSTTDHVHWQSIGTSSWKSNTNEMILPITLSGAHRYFRAVSN